MIALELPGISTSLKSSIYHTFPLMTVIEDELSVHKTDNVFFSFAKTYHSLLLPNKGIEVQCDNVPVAGI